VGAPIISTSYRWGGGATDVNVTWSGAIKEKPTWINEVIIPTQRTIRIEGWVLIGTRAGNYKFSVTTIGNDCPAITETGTITLTLPMTGCNFNDLPFELGDHSFATDQIWTVGTGSDAQEWSDAVRMSGCVARGSAYNGGFSGNYNADCRAPTNGFDGHYFSWCMVMRFADQLCPDDWRVPSVDDFWRLHGNLGYEPVSVVNTQSDLIPNTYITDDPAGTGQTPINRGGMWGGSRFTASARVLNDNTSFYWSCTQGNATRARYVSFTRLVAHPSHDFDKSSGYALRCVRDVE
jgi:uncharacterized protein (TIGR02145 family)